ncbi:MAG: hypothetical protein FWD13_02795 [Treponema sp.]|nr:hypothetical protein [Treponema sp.]
MKNLYIKKFLLCLLFIFLLPVFLSAFDFGLVAGLHGGIGNSAIEDFTGDFRVDIWPRFSMLLGDNGEFIVSAGVSMEEINKPIPELLHTELTMRFGNSGIRAGRFNYSDPTSMAAEGLFDGLQFFHNTAAGNFRIGAWYTGLLFKKNANITMTDNELANYNAALDYDDFINTYFAPSRAFVSIGWEHPSIGEFMHLNTAVIGQFDLTEGNDSYNNQYLIVKAKIPISNLLLELGGCIETSQSSSSTESFNISFAGNFGLFWLFPSEFNSRLSFTGTIAGGKINETFTEFVPITTKYYGFILKHKMSGLSVFSLNYSGRFSQALGLSFNASYFIRNDMATFKGYPLPSGAADEPAFKDFFLGPEFSARLIWSPTSDLQFNFGAGAFLPFLGSAGPDEKVLWRAELTATMSIW